jgi:hypothetical protein
MSLPTQADWGSQVVLLHASTPQKIFFTALGGGYAFSCPRDQWEANKLVDVSL